MGNELIDGSSYYLNAARVPLSLQPQQFGNWQIDRFALPEKARLGMPWKDYTLLRHKIFPKMDYSNMHLIADDGSMLDLVMEDSTRELRRHLPIWLKARGRVLKTGLGLGCVVRGFLANPAVTHVDVIEIDADIIRVIGEEFANNPKVSIYHGDALTYEFAEPIKWDFAWHDIWTEENKGLQVEHMKLIKRFDKVAQNQGAWQLPREIKRAAMNKGIKFIGAAE
jgi:hypothetical protein